MAGFFASGHAVDLVLLVIAVEFVVLSLRFLLSRAAGEGDRPQGGGGGSRDPTVGWSPPHHATHGPLPPLRRGRKLSGALIDRLLALLPGVFMLLALRAALTGAAWPWIAAPLAASFPFHLADLARRRL